jgi:hypothetical protein
MFLVATGVLRCNPYVFDSEYSIIISSSSFCGSKSISSSSKGTDMEKYTGKCWWCSHRAEAYVGCPLSLKTEKYRDNPSVKVMETVGYFCSYECVLAWVRNEKNSSLDQKARQMLFLLGLRQYEHFNSASLKPAPHWSNLIDKGGSMTIQEFRSFTTPLPKKKKGAKYKERKKRFALRKIGEKFGVTVRPVL